jgi:hypothetical protein
LQKITRGFIIVSRTARGGPVKTDRTQAPFTASYRNFKVNVCVDLMALP